MYDFLLCNIEICKYVHFDGCFKYLYLPQWRSRLEASRRLGVSNPSSDRPQVIKAGSNSSPAKHLATGASVTVPGR